MKKFILPLFAAFAINAAAQNIEVIAMDANALGLEKPQKGEDNKTVINDKILAKGTEIGKSTNVTVTTGDNEGTAPGAGHGWSSVTTHVAPYKFYQVGDQQIQGDQQVGIQGQSNGNQPTPLEEASALGAYLAFDGTGSFFNIKVEKDGYLYICNKMTGNKNYYVFVHQGDETVSAPIAYTVAGFGADWANAESGAFLGNENGIIKYTVAPSASTDLIQDMYTGTTAIGTPVSFFDGLASKNFMGVIKFKAQAGFTYAVMARGSKMSLGGVFFSPFEEEVSLYAPAQEATEEKEAVEAKTLKLLDGVEHPENAIKSVKNLNKGISAVKTIVNGKFVIVKEGKCFNLAGQIVK